MEVDISLKSFFHESILKGDLVYYIFEINHTKGSAFLNLKIVLF